MAYRGRGRRNRRGSIGRRRRGYGFSKRRRSFKKRGYSYSRAYQPIGNRM